MDNLETNSARWLAIALMLGSLIPLSGCRICADCEGIAYPAYGGAWQRTRRDSGRVGSIFDPGGAKASELVSRDMPPSPDEYDRRRQEERGDKISDPTMDDEDESVEEREREFDDRERMEEELRQKQLEDIEEKMEEELKKKDLDDINVRIVPGQPMPPILQ